MKPSTIKAPFPPLVALTIGILAVSTASIFIRFAQQDAPSLVIAAFRLSFATLVLAPFAISRHWQEIRSISRREMGLLMVSGLFLAFHFATWVTSLEYTSVASSAVLVQTTPLWVALLSVIVLRERLSRTVVAGLVVALAGGITVGLSEACQIGSGGLVCSTGQQLWQGRALLGNGLALAGAMFVSVYLIIGRRMRARLSLPTYVFLVYGSAAVFLLLGVAASGQSLVGYPPAVYGWCLALALVPQLLGHSIFNWALGYVPAALVSVTLLGEPIGSTILAYFILRQAPSPLELLGGALILVGIVLAAREQ